MTILRRFPYYWPYVLYAYEGAGRFLLTEEGQSMRSLDIYIDVKLKTLGYKLSDRFVIW